MATNDNLRRETRGYCLDIKKLVDKHFLNLGRNLFIIREKEYYKDWGFDTFRNYIDEDLDFSESMVYKFLATYEAFNKKVERSLLKQLGFRKVALIAQAHYLTEKKAIQIIHKAVKLTRRDLVKLLNRIEEKSSPNTQIKRFDIRVPRQESFFIERAFGHVAKEFEVKTKSEIVRELCRFYLERSGKGGVDLKELEKLEKQAAN